MVDRSDSFAFAQRLSIGVGAAMTRPRERRILVLSCALACFATWLSIAWGEPRALAALPLLAGADAVLLVGLRRREKPGNEPVPEVDPALLIARTRPPTPHTLAPVREPEAVPIPVAPPPRP